MSNKNHIENLSPDERIKRFHGEYRKLVEKYNLDFYAGSETDSRILGFIIRLFGKRHLKTRMFIKNRQENK